LKSTQTLCTAGACLTARAGENKADADRAWATLVALYKAAL